MLTEGKTKGGMSPKKPSTTKRPTDPPPSRKKSNLLSDIKEYFKELRFNPNHHLNLGDIRLTIGQQEEILQIIAESTNTEFKGI